MSDHKIIFSDNVFGAVVSLAFALVLMSMAYCTTVERRANAEVDKARVQAGLCREGWSGTWSKCK